MHVTVYTVITPSNLSSFDITIEKLSGEWTFGRKMTFYCLFTGLIKMEQLKWLTLD